MAKLKAQGLENELHSNRVVMILKDPPAPYRLGDWYLKPITGVPLVLLNILNLQRAGVEHLTVYHPGLEQGVERSRIDEFNQDRRLTLNLEWESDPDVLNEALKQGQYNWVVNGQALHRKQELKDVFSGESVGDTVRQVQIKEIPALTQFGQVRFEEKPGEETVGSLETLAYVSGSLDRQIIRKRDFRRQSEILLAECGLSNDSLMDRLVTRQISRQLTRFFVMTPLSPNQITFIAMFIGLLAGACFWSGGYEAGIAGSLLVLVSAWVDCADGEVARLRFQETPLGGILDIWADNIVHATVFFSIGMGLYFSTENGIYKILGTLAVLGTLGSFAILQSSLIDSKMKASEGGQEKEESTLVDQMANRDFVYFLFAMALLDLLNIFLGLTAVGSIAFALWLVFLRYRGGWSSSTGFCSKN